MPVFSSGGVSIRDAVSKTIGAEVEINGLRTSVTWVSFPHNDGKIFVI
jgi:hypothetical protein